MDTRQTLLVDAFAVDPGGGVPVAVVPDGTDLTDDQLRTVATELATETTTVPTDGPPDSFRVVGPGGPVDHHPHVTVGALAVAAERGWAGTDEFVVSTSTGDREVSVETDGRAWLTLRDPNPKVADVEHERLATALGVDVAALRDVGADLPPFVVSAGVDALAVPVNFLEHLSDTAPDGSALTELAEQFEVAAVCAFTFDTLAADAACHARTFVPDHADDEPPTQPAWARTIGREVPVTPAVTGGIVTHLFRESIIEEADTVVEQGHFVDRPGRVHVEVDSQTRVGGRTVTSLDGSMTVPSADDDDILEI